MGTIAFTIGGAPLYLYGTIASVGLLVALLVTWWSTWLYDEPFPYAFDVFLWGIPLGLIGARLGHIIKNASLYLNDPLAMFRFWEGGFSFYGAAIGFLLALFIVSSREDFPFLLWLDVIAPAAMLLIVTYSLTTFVMQQTVGTPMLFPTPDDTTIAEYVEFKYRPSGFENYEYFMPIALYQTAALIVLLILTLIMTVPEAHGTMFEHGGLFFIAVGLSSLIHFVAGYFYLSTNSGIHPGQIVSLVIAALCLLLFLKYGRRQKRGLWR